MLSIDRKFGLGVGEVRMKKGSGCESSKLDRKLIERNRRIHMKNLCFELASLIPPQHFKHAKEMISQQDQLDYAASYITQLKERIEKLKQMKEQAQRAIGNRNNPTDANMFGSRLPIIELRDLGCSIEVILISGLNRNFMFYEVINVLEEEGAEVVGASFYTAGDKIFHTLHAQVKISRLGVETSRVCQRLYELIC